jgi:hypothetical protein
LRRDGDLGPGDEHIGQVLAFAPADPDGLLPPRAVRSLLEEIRSDRLDTGLRLGILNGRGATTCGLLDGGDQERALAKTYRDRAQAATAWPRTKKLLNEVADSYQRVARVHDEEAERRHRGLPD